MQDIFSDGKPFPPVTVYTQPGCKPCVKVQTKLDNAGIDYDVVDLTVNDEAYAYVTQVLGAAGTPVIVSDADHVIIGDHPGKLEELIDYYTTSESGL